MPKSYFYDTYLRRKLERIKNAPYKLLSWIANIADSGLDTFKHDLKDDIAKLWLTNDTTSEQQLSGKKSKRNVILRWSNTWWCNYRCPYCMQLHKRKKDRHAFDKAPVQKWIDSFDRHFRDRQRNVLLLITGGEPMLDIKNMGTFLDELLARKYLLNIRIDTNASWSPSDYSHIKNKDKIWLMCTFHPTQTKENLFLDKISAFINEGYNIGMVNYVMTAESIPQFEKTLKILYKKNIPLHPNPLWNKQGKYSNDDIQLLKKYLPANDFLYRSETHKTFLKKCLFPAIAYQMFSSGMIQVACHPEYNANFLQDELPHLFKTYTRCPMKYCRCLDMYSFIKSFNRNYILNPLLCYKNDLLKIIQKNLIN